MSYRDIDNLYKNQDILLFKECYAMEKIHGSSAHICYLFTDATKKTNCILAFFAGGESHSKFMELFDKEFLTKKFEETFPSSCKVTIYGEVYGGKCQGMSLTYGKDLKFIAFEVKIDNNWLSVPQAEEIVKNFGLEFVFYEKIPATVEAIEKVCNEPSVQAVRNGMTEEKMREGVVLRSLIEFRKNNNGRIISKHKNEKHKETKTTRIISPEQLKILEDAKAIAEEWVTEMRLSHVLDAMGGEDNIGMEQTGDVIKAMIADVEKESKGEIVESKEARKAIGRIAVTMLKNRLKNKLKSYEEKA